VKHVDNRDVGADMVFAVKRNLKLEFFVRGCTVSFKFSFPIAEGIIGSKLNLFRNNWLIRRFSSGKFAWLRSCGGRMYTL
jgi:hypothetical protein